MDTNKNVYQRIFDAKKYIASQATKKKGQNTFSKYSYYTPEQIESLVVTACEQNGIDFHFSLLQDSLGLYGMTIIVNLDNPAETVRYELRTEVPEIKATNRTQQFGGAMTYCRRYMLQNIFSIVDNELDFDNEHSVYSKETYQQNGNRSNLVSEAQIKFFWAKSKEYGINEVRVAKLLAGHNLNSVKDIPKNMLDSLVEKMRQKHEEETALKQ